MPKYKLKNDVLVTQWKYTAYNHIRSIGKLMWIMPENNYEKLGENLSQEKHNFPIKELRIRKWKSFTL